MIAQRPLLVLAAAAGLVAGVIYYVGAQRVGVVVAAADLGAGRAIVAGDLEVREMPPDVLPPGTVRDLEALLGRYPKAPIWRGQLVLAGAVSDEPAAFGSGILPPTGYHAIAVPLSVPQALGGAIVPGARVDLIAVPIPGRAPEGRGTELLVASAFVIDVRGESGGELARRPEPRQPTTAIRERIGSVVIAVGPAQELLIADRTATSTFVLALVPRRP